MSNKNCGPDIVKYFVVEPSKTISISGATGDFSVCSGTTFVNTISGCTDNVNLNGVIFNNNGEVSFPQTLSACTGIHTSNLYGCSPITVHDEVILLSGLTFNSIYGDNTLTQVLVRDSVTGEVKYRDVSSITPDTNTFVTGGTLSGNDLILEKNNGVDVNPIDLSGLVSGKTDLSLFNSHTGDTNNPHQTSFSNLTSTAHTHTISEVINLQSELDSKTNNTDFVTHTGDTSIHFTKGSINLSDLGSTAHTHTLSEITDFNSYSGSVQTQLDGKVETNLFNSHTGDTNNPHQTSFSNLIATAHTHTISDVINLQTELDNKLDTSTFNAYSGNVQTQIDGKLNITDFNTYSGNVQTELNTKISGATNLSSEGVFAQKNGLDLEFKGITSTGGTVNISSNSSSVNLEVTFPTDQDKFVSGGTYNGGTKEINFVGNSVDTTFDVDLTSLVSSVSANTYVIDGVYNDSTDTLSLLRNDGNFVNITGITDTFTTGGTYDNSTALLSFTKNDSTTYDVDMSSLPLVDDITLEIDSNNDIRLKDFVGSPTGGTRTFDGQIIITSGLTLSTLGTGTSINNLGIDSSGNVVVGTTGGTNTNTYVTGFTFNPSTYDLTIKQNDGQPDLTSNLAVLASDVYVVSGVYNPYTGIVTYTNSSGGTFHVSGFTTGMTDSYTTAANLNGETIEFDNNIQGSNLYSVSLTPILSGKTDLSLFNSHTGDTNNPHQTSFSNLTSTAHTHTISDVTNLQTELDNKLNISNFNTYSGNVQTQLDTKIENGINSGGANEVFSGKSGTDLYFRTLSGGSNTTISTINDIIRVDVTVPVDTNTFVTGGTYNPTTDVITLTRNDAVTIDITGVTDTFTTGGTYDNGTSIITLTRNDSTTYDVDLTSLPSTDEVTIEINTLNEITLKEVVGAPTGGTRTFDSFITITSGLTLNNLGTGTSVNNLGIDSNGNIVIGTSGGTGTDYYVTGGTYNSGSLTLDRNDGNSVVVTGFLTGNTLQEVLVNGNTSGGNNIVMSEGDDLVFKYSTFNSFINTNALNADRTILFPDKSGTVALLSDTTGHTENYYVTGFTYNDANTFTISQNGGLGDLTSTINNVTGLTVNGNLDIIGDINVTGTTYYTNITGTSIGVDYIDFNNALTPLPADQEGRIYWDEDNGTLSLGMHGGQVVQQIGLEQYYYVKNQSGATIENGRVVRAAGTLGSSGRILGEYMIADGTIPAKFTLGIATEDIVNGDDGYVTEFGLVRGIDASGTLYGESWSGGTILYVSPTTPGGLTSVEPQAPDLKIEMAIVIDADANGSIFVRPNRYPRLYDLQQVNYTGGSENNLDILQWNSSNSTWDKTNTPSFSGLTMYGDITMDESALRYIKSSGPSETSRIKFGSSGSSVNMEWIGGGNNTIIDVNSTSFISVSSSKPSFGGIVYGADYSLNYDDRSLIDLGYFNSNDRYVTGFTYNDANTLTLSRSAGLSDLTTSINTLTGLTINGNLDVSGTLNIGTIGTGTSVNNIGIDSSGNIVTGNTGSGIYGGDGVVPLDTTVSVNGDLTFQGLDEDTRLIVKDGNGGSAIHLFSDGNQGQSALEFRTPTTNVLLHKIQIAGGDTRYVSNNRDLLFTTNDSVNTEGFFIQAGTGNMGIGTITPSESLDVVGNTTISGTLNIGTIGGGTPVGNLGFDSNGQVVTGTTGGGTGVSDANKVFSWFMNVT